ncbi:MAG: GTP-binding protein [Lachnospiraceae bacterium]|nr:GTP-binding protein [Lachnospiraceae bacterium]
MIIRDVQLETVCGITSRFPENEFPEIAFAGKSNVGKSSLLNTLVNRKSLARTSAQPGKTQTVNFYHIVGYPEFKAPAGQAEPEVEGVQASAAKEQRVAEDIYFVDLPGYGYAKASRESVAAWGRMIEKYLHTSRQLKYVLLLVDIRHAPGENDRLMYRWIVESGFKPVIIATKLDKIKRSQTAKQLKQIREGLKAPGDTIMIPFSAETKQGRDEIWKLLESVSQAPAEG